MHLSTYSWVGTWLAYFAQPVRVQMMAHPVRHVFEKVSANLPSDPVEVEFIDLFYRKVEADAQPGKNFA